MAWILLKVSIICFWGSLTQSELGLAPPTDQLRFPVGSPPDVFIYGAQKCGTSALHAKLVEFPTICGASGKEPHFFDFHFRKGFESYKKYFAHCSPWQIILDSTPFDDWNGTIAERIYNTYHHSDMMHKKFIIILRDPAYREYSWYKHLIDNCALHMRTYMLRKLRHGSIVGNQTRTESSLTDLYSDNSSLPSWNTRELCGIKHRLPWCASLLCEAKAAHIRPGEERMVLATFAQYVKLAPSLLSRGNYYDRLMKLLKYVDRKNVFIVSFDALFEKHPVRTLGQIVAFINTIPGYREVRLSAEELQMAALRSSLNSNLSPPNLYGTNMSNQTIDAHLHHISSQRRRTTVLSAVTAGSTITTNNRENNENNTIDSNNTVESVLPANKKIHSTPPDLVKIRKQRVPMNFANNRTIFSEKINSREHDPTEFHTRYDCATAQYLQRAHTANTARLLQYLRTSKNNGLAPRSEPHFTPFNIHSCEP